MARAANRTERPPRELPVSPPGAGAIAVSAHVGGAGRRLVGLTDLERAPGRVRGTGARQFGPSEATEAIRLTITSVRRRFWQSRCSFRQVSGHAFPPALPEGQ